MTPRRSVWVVPFIEESDMVLIAKRSASTNNPKLWNFFGGGAGNNENPRKAAAREFREEAGIKIRARDLTHIGDTKMTTTKSLYVMSYYRMDAASAIVPRLNDENSSFKWVSIFTLRDMQKIHHSIRGFSRYLDAMVVERSTASFLEGCSCSTEKSRFGDTVKIYNGNRAIAVARLSANGILSRLRFSKYFQNHSKALSDYMVNETGAVGIDNRTLGITSEFFIKTSSGRSFVSPRKIGGTNG